MDTTFNLANSPTSNNCPEFGPDQGHPKRLYHMTWWGQYSSGGDGENGAVEKALTTMRDGGGSISRER
ncbi:MAG: hypothetical protein Ct9H90mP24_0560 [Methanobacteriota archaeon]|nr:MAG: hypothetical protein Ct9H90mP24_0560 [Euryarchaeota archaeon]